MIFLAHADASDTEAVAAQCQHCRHCEPDRLVLESVIPGLASFGSALGASLGDSRLCRLRDQLVSPRDSCAKFQALF